MTLSDPRLRALLPVPVTSRRAAGDPWWGLDLVNLPDIPPVGPDEALLSDPRVPADHRACGKCGEDVGQRHDGQEALDEGYCPWCGNGFSFIPKLKAGDLLSGDRYRVTGCIGFGGVSWVYLAEDTHVQNLPVAVKALIDPGSEINAETVKKELSLLIEVEHPNIVRLRDFAEKDQYLVMEYVPGPTVEKTARGGLRIEHALAYGLHLLAAVDRLHAQDWLHCDINPRNLMLTGNGVKLIDLGGGCKNGTENHRWGTRGYRAPEVDDAGKPSPRSDLFSVGMTLRNMTGRPARHYGGDERPGDDDQASAAAESLENFLARATDPDPDNRFPNATQMAGQLSGVLRQFAELRARTLPGQEPPDAPSLVFRAENELLDGTPGDIPPLERWLTAEAFAAARSGDFPSADSSPGAALLATRLPAPRPDPADPAANMVAMLGAANPEAARSQLADAGQYKVSVEANLLDCRRMLAAGDPQKARDGLVQARECLVKSSGLRENGDFGWRLRWHEGLLKLAEDDVPGARDAFTAVYRALPGEVVPKLAMGLCAERLGKPDEAGRYYEMAWRADRSYASAAFGLARARARRGEREAAVNTVDEVPALSRHAFKARVAAFRLLTGRAGEDDWPAPGDLDEAEKRLEKSPLAGEGIGLDQRQRLTALLLEARLRQARAESGRGSRTVPRAARAEARARVRAAREALEQCYRQMAGHIGGAQQGALTDLAHRVRPASLD